MRKVILGVSPILITLLLLSACAKPAPAEHVSTVSAPQDPSKEGVLVGVTEVGEMVVQLELEPAKATSMFVNGMWMEMKVATGELYHVEVKTIDPKSNTRVSYAPVKFSSVNKDNGTVTEGMLHPMWGGSGLHYAFNSGLAGDGTYEATVTLEPPTFARSMSDKDKWMKPIVAFFHFRIAGGKVVEAEVHEH